MLEVTHHQQDSGGGGGQNENDMTGEVMSCRALTMIYESFCPRAVQFMEGPALAPKSSMNREMLPYDVVLEDRIRYCWLCQYLRLCWCGLQEML